MRILICGDRNWDDWSPITQLLRKEHFLNPDLVIIEGGAKGADRCARQAAEFLNIPYLEFPADWKRYHKGAGPIRNQQMLAEGRPTKIWAFHKKIWESKGTYSMISFGLRISIPVTLWTDEVTSFKFDNIDDFNTFLEARLGERISQLVAKQGKLQ